MKSGGREEGQVIFPGGVLQKRATTPEANDVLCLGKGPLLGGKEVTEKSTGLKRWKKDEDQGGGGEGGVPWRGDGRRLGRVLKHMIFWGKDWGKRGGNVKNPRALKEGFRKKPAAVANPPRYGRRHRTQKSQARRTSTAAAPPGTKGN